MVPTMAYRDTEAESIPHVPGAVAPLPLAPDWQRLYEQTLERAEAAEARAEELTSAELSARSDAACWRSQFQAARRKRLDAVGRENEARRAEKALRREVARMHKAMPKAEARAAEIDHLRKSLRQAGENQAQLRHLLHEALRLHDKLKGKYRRLRAALKRAVTAKDGLKARLRRLTVPAAADADLRKALGRSRRQKTALNAATKENTRLRRTVARLRRRTGKQETEIAKLRATRAVLSKALHGRKSEMRERPGTGRPRGQVRGAPGHGRTPRPGIEEHDPPKAARVCAGCGKPYAAVGADESALLEIDVKAHRRVIRRGRRRRTCDCASSPAEVSAAPVPRLFANTSCGVSVWSRVLYERHVCLRPVKRVGAWLGDQGLPVAAGTLAASVPRFVPLFEPLAEAILAHQAEAALRHADETGWRVQELRGEGRSARAWLWTSVGDDAVYFHIDPSRSAEAARTLLGELRAGTVIVCDRYSAYKRLERLLDGTVTLRFCWSHQRRDFIQCAAGQTDLTGWCEAWLERIAAIYRLNEERLKHRDPGVERRNDAYDAAQAAPEAALDDLFARAGRELAALPDDAREAKALRSPVNRREGLAVFVQRPRTPMDDNLAERLLRGPVIGRRLSFGSGSVTGAKLAALMYSVVGTLNLNGIDVLRWLDAWLAACAQNGGRPPDDLAPWLPWSMDAARRRELTAPG